MFMPFEIHICLHADIFFLIRYREKMQQVTCQTIYTLGDGFENCLALIDLLRTLPSTSVKNEISFSIMKLTKGKRRPRMNPSTVNDLMTVSLMSPPVTEFDPTKSIEHFLVRYNCSVQCDM